jgi:hypothetical protein
MLLVTTGAQVVTEGDVGDAMTDPGAYGATHRRIRDAEGDRA